MNDSLVAGTAAGFFVRLCINPLDVLKIRFQLQQEPIHWVSKESKYKSLMNAVRTVMKEEGVIAFWKGLIPGQVMYMVYGGAQFYMFDLCKRRLMTKFPNMSLKWTSASNFAVGVVSGSVASVASHPLDVVRTRFIAQGEPKTYSTIPNAIAMMYKENGIRCFYKGLLPSLMYIAPQAGLYFGFYHCLTLLWDRSLGHQHAMLALRSLSCGGLAGIGSKIIILPFDLLKKRLAVQGFEVARQQFGKVTKYNGVLDCFIKVVKEEGVMAFYKGTAPTILKAAASVSLSFTFYESILFWLQSRHSNS